VAKPLLRLVRLVACRSDRLEAGFYGGKGMRHSFGKRSAFVACALAVAAGVFVVGGRIAKVDAGTPADKVTVAGSHFTVINDNLARRRAHRVLRPREHADADHWQ